MPLALAPVARLGGARFIVNALGAVLVVLDAFPLLTCVLHCVLPIVPHSRLQHVISVKQQGMCRRRTEGVSPLVSRAFRAPFLFLRSLLLGGRHRPAVEFLWAGPNLALKFSPMKLEHFRPTFWRERKFLRSHVATGPQEREAKHHSGTPPKCRLGVRARRRATPLSRSEENNHAQSNTTR